MLKIYSWNVNGIRAVTRKELFQPFIDKEKPDILCLQEIKAKPEQIELGLPEYEEFIYSADKPGYSGTAILSKVKPLQVVNGLPKDLIKKYGVEGDTYGDPNLEGRVIAAEFDKFWVVTAYTPNAKDDLSRLPVRQKWDAAMVAYCKQLEMGTVLSGSDLSGVQGSNEQQASRTSGTVSEPHRQLTPQSAKSSGGVGGSADKQGAAIRGREQKPVIYCGDMNVAHTEDDLANPKPNVGKKGFTAEERAGFDNWLAAGFVDTFRMFQQGNGYYTWWSHFANARERNVGWRLDYFLVSESIKDKIKSAEIHPKVMGSDHCPVSITLDI